MKDAYSLGANLEQLNESYDAMFEAYCRIFDRAGLDYVVVEAESGPIGGDSSHEFMVPSQTGEDHIIQCKTCGYAANQERAEIGKPNTKPKEPAASAPAYQAVSTPNKRTIDEVAAFLKVKAEESAKLLVYQADGKPVAALLRGDREANEAKIRRAFKASSIAPADPETIHKATGVPIGFLGPVAIKIPLVVDHEIALMETVVVGGNAVDVHLTGVVPGRDFPLDNLHDVRNAGAGDACPKCGAEMVLTQGIEIGHVFKLGTKYSKAMGATFLDNQGKTVELIMGCYGIGANRIVAAAVESGHDANGIVWPLPLAPYQVVVAPLQTQNAEVSEKANEIAKALEAAGFDVLVDDRELKPGVKFKDVDLIGIPLRIVVSERGLKEGSIEMKWRTESQAKNVAASEAAQTAIAELRSAWQTLSSRCEDRLQKRGKS